MFWSAGRAAILFPSHFWFFFLPFCLNLALFLSSASYFEPGLNFNPFLFIMYLNIPLFRLQAPLLQRISSFSHLRIRFYVYILPLFSSVPLFPDSSVPFLSDFSHFLVLRIIHLFPGLFKLKIESINHVILPRFSSFQPVFMP